MDRTANQSTSLRTPWREALKRAGSFDELRPYLHTGQIPAHHGGLFTFPEGKVHSGPGILGPEMWAVVDKDRAGRVIFFTSEVVFGRPVQEQVFAYDRGIELDSAAFDVFFPVAGLPPAEQAHPRPLTTQAETEASLPATQLDESPQTDPAPSSAPKKWSRKKPPHGGPQARRATAVLNRIFPSESDRTSESKYRDRYPDEDEMTWTDVWIKFCGEYERYAKNYPSKYECPSQLTVKRVMGRAE